ncbi:MAG: hypothetical protein AB1344_10860 [Pseudomonadota bacterium]
MNMKVFQTALALLPLLAPLTTHAEIVVFTGARSDIESLSRNDVINIFMGRYRTLPNGQAALPLEQEADAPERRQFYLKLLNKRPEEIHAYWARLRFSGRTEPPRAISGREDYLREIASTPGAIGYAERRALTRDLRILLSLPE